MARLVKLKSEASLAAGTADDYAGRVAKYIPAEIVVAYLSINNLIAANSMDPIAVPTGYWVIVICWLLVPAYLWTMGLKGQSSKREIAVSALVGIVAFPIWVYALGGISIEHWPGHNLLVAGILLPLFTLVVGAFDR